MPYCNNHSGNHCNKDNTYNIINLVNAVVQNIGEYKMITGKIPKKNKQSKNIKQSYNNIKEMIIKETNINRLQNNGHWDNIIRKSSFSELQKLRQIILNEKIKVENEIKTEFQTVFIKQELNDKMKELDNIKQEPDDKKETVNNESEDNHELLTIDNKQEVEYYKLEQIDNIQEIKLPVVDDEQDIEYRESKQEVELSMIGNEQKMKEIEYNAPEQEAELLVVGDEQNIKQIEYSSSQTDDMEVKLSMIDNEQNMKEIEYHESEQIQTDDMEEVEFPSIDNTSDMEDVLIHFQLNEEDVRYINFIKAQELYTEMFNDPQIERLQDGQHWSIEIDNLNCDHLPNTFKTKMHELRQWTYNKKRDNMNKIEYPQTHLEESLQTDNEIRNKETLKIEYPTEEFQKETDMVIFPEIDNIDEMEITLSNFEIKNEERFKESIQEYIMYYNTFKHIQEADYELLEDNNHWLNLINDLSYQSLPDNYKTKLIEFYENDLEKKKQQQIDKEISDKTPNLLSSITGYTLDLFGYGSDDNGSDDKKRKRPKLLENSEYENLKVKRRKLNKRDPKKASKMRPKLVKPGFNNIVDDIIIDINNIIDQYKKTMDNSLEDYSKQFEEIRKIIHEKYNIVLYKRTFLELLYDLWVLEKPKSYLVDKYKSEILVNDIERLVDKFPI